MADPKRESIKRAHERAYEDVENEAEMLGAESAKMQAEFKDSSFEQAQAREAAESLAAAYEEAEPKAQAVAEQKRQTSPADAEAHPHPAEHNRQARERMQPQEKKGTAGWRAQGTSGQDADGSEELEVTEHRMDEMASAVVPDNPESLKNEAGPTDNISVHGAYSDDPDEVDQISGPPMESISKDKVEK